MATDNCDADVTNIVKIAGAFVPGACDGAGSYTNTWTVTDDCGNVSAVYTQVITITDTQAPTIISCPSDISINTSPGTCGSAVTWTTPGATDNCGTINVTSNYNSGDTFISGTTLVTYTFTDICGNSATCSFNVTVNDTEAPTITCPGNISQTAATGQITASVVVPDPVSSDNCSVSSVTWTMSGATTASSPATGINMIGTYTFNEGITDVTYSVTDPAALSSTCNFTVTVFSASLPLTGTITSQTNVLCFNDATGSVTVSGADGIPPYEYSINGGAYQSSGTFPSLSAGSYTLTVRDAVLTRFDISVSITEPAPISPAIVNQNNVSCSAGSDGSVTISATGGTGSYEYSMDGGTYQASGNFTGLAANSYAVNIRDENGCTGSISVSITEPSELTISATVTDASCPDVNDGSVSLSVSGGTPPYNYIWSDGITTDERSGIAGGTYSIIVTDANACAASLTIDVNIAGSAECIIIQEIITPNNDGFNDTWKIRNIHLFPDAEVLVYNRWGKLVFRTKNIADNEWDGTSDGKLLPTDSYHYILHLNDGSGPKSGVISIIW